jgi:TPP-dependent pyruvate/acetoin dehydrogenase alpha subunit
MCARLILGASLGLWLLIFAAYAEEADPLVALGNHLTAQDVLRGDTMQSLRALIQAYQGEKAKLAAAQKRASELEAYWKAYIASDGMVPTKP